MRLPWSVSCMHAGTCVCMCVYASVSETEISEWVYVCVCVGGSDMVYGCGSEGRQNENSGYACAKYIAYLLY